MNDDIRVTSCVQGDLRLLQYLFLSFAHADKPLDRKFRDQLRQRRPRVWHDHDQLQSRSRPTREVQDALDTLPGVVFLLIVRLITRPFVRYAELKRASRRSDTQLIGINAPTHRVVRRSQATIAKSFRGELVRDLT